MFEWPLLKARCKPYKRFHIAILLPGVFKKRFKLKKGTAQAAVNYVSGDTMRSARYKNRESHALKARTRNAKANR